MERTGKGKRLGVILVILAALVVLGGLFWALWGRNRVVGRITGPEWDYLEIDGVTYARRDSTPYGIQDKGKFLGLAAAGEERFRLYAVKGDEEGRYVYCFWDWEGFFYEKE